MKIGIVGAGKVGLSLAGALSERGQDVILLSEHYGGTLPFLRRRDARGFLERCDGVIISVRDRDIGSTSEYLASAGADVKGKAFLHTAGALDPSVLSPLKAKGSAVGVMHPIQSFPRPDPGLIAGIYMGISGDDEAISLAGQVASTLGCKTIRVKDHALYHAACVMSAGFIGTLIKLAARVISEASDGDWRAVIPMAERTLKNIEEMGPERALTGPQIRGDWETVSAHMRKLRAFDPGLALLYNLLSAEMTEKEKGGLDPVLLSVLACPKCKGELEYRKDDSALICHNCRLRFRIEDGIPIMLISEAESF
ncbi:MAG: DUF2520 domain-containing protein [candidate division WOR-3 bacterium]